MCLYALWMKILAYKANWNSFIDYSGTRTRIQKVLQLSE